MKKFLLLPLCLSLSFFAVAHATKPAHTPAFDTKTAQNERTGQEADAKTLLYNANTDEDVASDDDDSKEIPSNDEGEDVNDDGDGGNAAAGDEDTVDGDGGHDDDGGDASDDSGGDEGK
jgi:hypothetical protein